MPNQWALKAKDVNLKAWEARKLNSDTRSMIQALKAEGRKLVLGGKLPRKEHQNWKNKGSSGQLDWRSQNHWTGSTFDTTCSSQDMGLWTRISNT